MLRRLQIGFGMGLVLALLAGDARAQFGYGYYPSGYGSYGWGGWGGGVGTVQGSIARGLGVYNMGAGLYNEETAAARAINEATVKDWNEFMFLSQQEANRREYLRKARQERRDAASGDLVQQRIRDNPTDRDIRNGDALNAILDQLTDPRVHSSALRLAADPLEGDVVREIPFENASEGVTISLDQLTAKDGWPFALRGDNFAAERKAYEAAVDQALKEDQEGSVKPETLQAMRNALGLLHDKFEAAPPRDRVQRVNAENYLKTLYGMTKMLENPRVDQIVAELEKIPKTSLGSLLGFMHTFNLRFGPSTTPKQEAVYQQLYPLMAAQRDKILKAVGTDQEAATARNTAPPTDFYQGMHLDTLSGRKKPTTPPPDPNSK